MSTHPINLKTRISTLNAVLTKKADQQKVAKALREAKGDPAVALAKLKGKLPAAALQKVALAHSLAVLSDDNVSLVKALTEQPHVTSLRDVALNFNVDQLAALVEPRVMPAAARGATAHENARSFAVAFQRKLFTAEPTAVLHRMVREAEVPIADTSVRAGVISFLSNQPDFNIRTTSVLSALQHPEAFTDIADDHRPGVIAQLKTLQRVQAISPIPEAVPVLMKADLTSAFQVGEMPESTFIAAHSQAMGSEETARQVYTTAINSRIRNEQVLTTMREAVRGTGLAIIDGPQPPEARLAEMQAVVDQHNVPLNLEALFGNMDYCECEECTSVYSPAAYFVDILQYLRNNDLDPDNPHTGQKGIAGTQLEKLFRRRPDLGCLELTCANTNTVLPYIDLVNEVMESFVVHLSQYHVDTNTPKQAQLEVFNVEDEASSELLAQPQHINYEAYCILKNAVYPFTLPYHQPIDAARISLNYLGTSRYELLDTYRTANEYCPGAQIPPDEDQELQVLHQTVLDRAVDAEFLGLTQEEYVILTKEAFWPKRYFDITQQQSHTEDEYRQKIGVKPVHEYYGYGTEADMLSTDETELKGLTFVKKQFLPRTGIQYVDLVELLKTQFINPNFPQGEALTLLESVRFSYRFLQTLVDTNITDPKVRFARLIAFLEQIQPLLPLIDAQLHPDPCHQQAHHSSMEYKDLRRWVYCYFERIGQLIVLESGEGPQLPVEGQLFRDPEAAMFPSVGTLTKDGTIADPSGQIIGHVSVAIGPPNNAALAGPVIGTDGKPLVNKERFGSDWLSIRQDAGTVPVGYITPSGLLVSPLREGAITWLPARDTCDLTKVRLTHLDGTPVNVEEYDRMQRFIRLWHKMERTVDETDKALVGLSNPPAGTGGGTTEEDCTYVDFDTFNDDCSHAGGETNGDCSGGTEQQTDDCCCPELVKISSDITPYFLHQLVAVRKLLDLTGLPLAKLLTFWSDISIAGEKSLYARLFLTHNLLGVDKVFRADKDGNYLTQPAKITDHLPVLMAALKIKADDILAIMAFRQLPDALTLANVSLLYRHSLLAKILHVKVAELPEVTALFGEPFTDAYRTLALLKTWGKMEDAGFTFRQLNYVIRNHDDALRPLSPTKRTILRVTKTLYDGLKAIDHDHADVSEEKKDDATTDLVRAKAGLLFEQAVVDQIIGLLEGTTVYTTNAPPGLSITVPESLAKKLKYNSQNDANPPRATIQVTGILAESEKIQTKALSTHPDWPKAIDRVGKQALNFFNDVLFGIFSDGTDAKAKLLAGNATPASQDPSVPDPKTEARFYFLQHFLPFLRKGLAERFIVETMSGAAGLSSELTKVLLSDVLVAGTPSRPALDALQSVKDEPAASASGWRGYLIPSVEDAYTFIAISDTPPAPLVLDGQSIPFPHQQEDPSNVWSADPIKLKSGKLLWLDTAGLAAGQLQWKTATSPKAAIPSSALLPDYASQGTEEAFTKLYKAALLINGFALGVDEVSYCQTHAADFDAFDFNAVTLRHWQRLQAYTDLRGDLPKLETTLLDLFKWACHPDDPAKLSEQIASVTNWKKENIDKLIEPHHFDVNRPDAFRNEVTLVKLLHAVIVVDQIGVDIDRLFQWAKPESKFSVCHQIAESIRKTIRARYDQEDWEQVVKPLNDQLRQHQKLALISYLLVQQDLIDWGVVDADSLFEFFLIDVQMEPCMETSRIKQAISTVQLFVQRCMLGLEEQYGVPNNVLDRDRWDWMQRYRVWEANRKVFLYPENWIQSELRDDKSPFYKELESELLQKDVNPQTVQDALKSYLFKVDEVANLKVVGLFLEQDVDQLGSVVNIKLHVFARTRNAPYFFYYRYFHAQEKNWYPWEKIQVDIPNYDVEDANGVITENGTYLIPAIWNKRLLLFFPQFARKTATTPPGSAKKIKDIGDTTPTENKPVEYWEIRMAWSEYRNNKWTQKQVSSEVVCHPSVFPSTLPSIQSYEFIPRILAGTDPRVVIDVTLGTTGLSVFSFRGSQLSRDGAPGNPNTLSTDFHYNPTAPPQIHSLQASDPSNPPPLSGNGIEPYFADSKTSVAVHQDGIGANFYHPFAHELLGTLTAGSLDELFDYYGNQIPDDSATVPHKRDAFGGDDKAVYHELKSSYSLFNWEAAFHAPMFLVDRLLKAQQFDQALDMCHYVFNPLANGTGKDRFWQFPPFKEIDAENVLENLFLGLQPGQPDDAINEWRNKPFQPHVVARSRPSAYMKWVVMKYIEVLIAYGDYLFRQNTLETVPMAIQCYVLAAHTYGPPGQMIPKRGKINPQTYNSLLDRWDAFSNAMVELELAFPFSNQTPLPIGVSNGVVGLANIFGFATTLYFCIPDNPQLRGLRSTIDDRLFKLRHCEDIEGVFRKLPLFEPPIDPALLVQAAAQGLSLSSVLNDLNGPMPNYRFYYLLQKALELCSELKALGNAFLSAKEKGDAEALSQLRAQHETSIHRLVMEVRKQQLDEAQKSLEALQQSRKGPVYRLQHFLKLIGEDLGKVPDGATDFGELPDQIEAPVDEGGLKLIPYEKEEMDKASAAADWQTGIGIVETLASVFHALPTMDVHGTPLGVGVAVCWGFPNLANATSAVARGLRIYADHLSYQSSRASRKGGFLRQLQDRVQQANVAGYEIKNIDKQVLTQQIRINIAEQEITNQQKQIDNAQEVEEFLRNKYTNQDLYSWMEGSIRTLYHQAYTLAYDVAKKAEKIFRFERALTTSSFIQFGYWEAAHDGLLAGEQMYVALKQLEAAYQEKRGYDYEIMKPISLRQVNPLALIRLKETGTCEFVIPEVLFDMDHPGQYLRRIKSVALTVPCVIGPFTSLNCTLRLLEHQFRTSAIAKDKTDYLEKTDETDDRFSTLNVPITSIAVSTGQNDSGVFELNFRDERYIPFEGAGVISKWRIELPEKFRQFDYETISDVVLHVRYTSVEGGDKLKAAAADSVQEYVKNVEQLSREEGLFAAFDLKHDFPSDWYKAMQPPAGATERLILLNNLNERLPIFTKGRPPGRVQATDIYLLTPAALPAAAFVLAQGTDELTFTDGPPVGTMKSFVIKDISSLPMTNWQVKIQDTKVELEKLWLLVRYVLK